MSMKRRGATQESLWVPHSAVQEGPGHRFYEKLDEILIDHGFDRHVEDICKPYYADKVGRGSIPPSVYFRMLLVGYYEGIESERGICWRVQDSFSLRRFLGLRLTDSVPHHTSLCRIRQRLDGSVYRDVFRFALKVVAESGLLSGKVVGVDSTYLRADASMKSIVRKDSGQSYADYLVKLAEEAGIENPSQEDARRLDRKREKKTSNREWESATDEDARVARLKDGRTRLAYKPEHAVDLETGVVVAAEVYHADEADTATIGRTLEGAAGNILEAVAGDDSECSDGDADADSVIDACVEVVADKGYQKTSLLLDLEEDGYRTYIPERAQARCWKGKSPDIIRVVRNARARNRRAKAKALHRLRGELVERVFAHVCETGGGRRTRLRGLDNMRKRYLIQVAALNLSILMRAITGKGTPRGLAEKAVSVILSSCSPRALMDFIWRVVLG